MEPYSLSSIYSTSLALLTDFYQLTMAYGYWKAKMENDEAVFHLIFRHSPFQGGFTVAAGLEATVHYIEQFRFTSSDLSYLAEQKGADGEILFPEEFLNYLSKLKLEVDVDAVPEGTVVFPQEPLIRVRGPLLHCQLLESPLLNLINFPTLIATKAARIRLSAKEDSLLEFGMRRAQGIDGALTASRSAYIGGFDATSNVLAGKLFGIPARGTHSHSWVMAFDTEKESFEVFANAFPGNSVFLVDTYGSIEGVKHAIEVAKSIRDLGKRFLGIRLDSGDLTYLSVKSRQMLDDAGFQEARIFASNELEETVIADLKRQGSQVAIWGVGTHLVTGKGHPALDGVYKLSAFRKKGKKWQHKLKLSEQMIKVSNPGVMQVRRFQNGEGYMADMLWDELTGVASPCMLVDPLDPTRQKVIDSNWTGQDLLVPIFQKGEKVYSLPSLKEIKEKVRRDLSLLHRGVKRFLNPHQYVVGMEKQFYDLKVGLIRKIRKELQKDT